MEVRPLDSVEVEAKQTHEQLKPSAASLTGYAHSPDTCEHRRENDQGVMESTYKAQNRVKTCCMCGDRWIKKPDGSFHHAIARQHPDRPNPTGVTFAMQGEWQASSQQPSQPSQPRSSRPARASPVATTPTSWMASSSRVASSKQPGTKAEKANNAHTAMALAETPCTPDKDKRWRLKMALADTPCKPDNW